jgi:hypothetical protein
VDQTEDGADKKLEKYELGNEAGVAFVRTEAVCGPERGNCSGFHGVECGAIPNKDGVSGIDHQPHHRRLETRGRGPRSISSLRPSHKFIGGFKENGLLHIKRFVPLKEPDEYVDRLERQRRHFESGQRKALLNAG